MSLASLVMPIGDPPDRFFYPTLTLMMDSYIGYLYMRLPTGSQEAKFLKIDLAQLSSQKRFDFRNS